MDNTLYNLVTFHNPLEIPFTIVYNNETVRTIPAGGTMQIVKMWADAGKIDLVNILMRRDKVSLLNRQERSKYEMKVILGEEGSLLSQTPTQNELANQLLEKASNPASNPTSWKFDPLTGRPLQAEQAMPHPEPTPEPPKITYTNPEIASVMGNVSSGSGSLPAQDMTTDEPAVIEDKSNATKEQVVAWMRATLPLDFDNPKVLEEIDSMSVEQLRKAHNYDNLA